MSLSLIIFISIFSFLIKNDKNYNHAYGVFLSDINITKLFISNKDTTIKQEGDGLVTLPGVGRIINDRGILSIVTFSTVFFSPSCLLVIFLLLLNSFVILISLKKTP